MTSFFVELFFFKYVSTEMVYLQRCLVVTWLEPRETAAVSACFVYRVQPCTISGHFMQSHMSRVRVCLTVLERSESFMCYCDNTGVERILK